jgi:hypothetical protein
MPPNLRIPRNFRSYSVLRTIDRYVGTAHILPTAAQQQACFENSSCADRMRPDSDRLRGGAAGLGAYPEREEFDWWQWRPCPSVREATTTVNDWFGDGHHGLHRRS